MKLKDYLTKQRKIIEQALDTYLPQESDYPSVIHRAMRYSVRGGKRIRPILALAACEVSGGDIKDTLSGALGIELIHAYSLVHDDLPALDNDCLRRDRPSCHKKFGEDIAILTGDALLTLAFSLIAQGKDAIMQLRVIKEVSKAIGTEGMIGGQVVDMAEPRDAKRSEERLEYISTHKTGALIAAALKIGAITGGGSKKGIDALFRFGKYLGQCFQVVDDIIDGDGYVLTLGPEKAKKEAADLSKKAEKELSIFGKKGDRLKEIAAYILGRAM